MNQEDRPLTMHILYSRSGKEVILQAIETSQKSLSKTNEAILHYISLYLVLKKE